MSNKKKVIGWIIVLIGIAAAAARILLLLH